MIHFSETFVDHGSFHLFENLPLGENQEVLVKGSNFLVEPGTSGKKSEIGDLRVPGR